MNADQIRAKPTTELDFVNKLNESMARVTQAHWDYLDLKHAKNPKKFPKMGIKKFMELFYDIDTRLATAYIRDYNRYQKNLPTSGVLMYHRDLLNKEIYFIVVRINAVKMWSMPKGKHNPKETSVSAGPREFREETGIDTRDLIDNDTPVKVLNRTNFFIVESDTKLDVSKYSTREIAAVRWVSAREVLSNKLPGKYSKQVQMAAEHLLDM